MKPVLYDSNETTFQTLGIGKLTDTIRCEVTEERNGIYELAMTYPITGIHYSEIQNDRLILAKPNETSQDQPFRIYAISKPIGGIVEINAEHISYQLNNIPVSPFSAGSIAEAVVGLASHSATDNPFTLSTDKTNTGNFAVTVPTNHRALLGGMQGSLLDVYGGGEYEYDRYSIILRNERGRDNGVKIKYGKNLTDVRQDESIASLLTGVYPYWASGEEYVELPEKVIQLQSDYAFPRVQPLDLSDQFEDAPTVEVLRQAAERYIETSDLTTPKVSISVSFVQLWQTENYKNDPLYQQIAGLERLSLCDLVTVEYLALGVSTKAKIVRTIYDVLNERYVKMDIGEPRTNMSTRMAEQQKELANTPTKSFLEQAILNATNAITGYSGGYVVLEPPNHPQRIMIMDTDDKVTARKVWQWNLNGLGYSSTGIDGPYALAMTTNPGAFVADFITAGTLTANIIKAGILASANNASTINMETGVANMSGAFTTSEGIFTMELRGGVLRFYINGAIAGEFAMSDTSQVGSRVRAQGFELRPNAAGTSAGSFQVDTSGTTSSLFTTNISLGGSTLRKSTLTINGVPTNVVTW